MDIKAFSPRGKTVVVTAAVSPPLGVQVPEVGTTNGIQIRIYNAGTATAYLAFGASAATAQSNAVIPTSTPQNVVSLPAGIVEVLSFPVGSYFSGVTASGTADIHLLAGAGV